MEELPFAHYWAAAEPAVVELHQQESRLNNYDECMQAIDALFFRKPQPAILPPTPTMDLDDLSFLHRISKPYIMPRLPIIDMSSLGRLQTRLVHTKRDWTQTAVHADFISITRYHRCSFSAHGKDHARWCEDGSIVAFYFENQKVTSVVLTDYCRCVKGVYFDHLGGVWIWGLGKPRSVVLRMNRDFKVSLFGSFGEYISWIQLTLDDKVVIMQRNLGPSVIVMTLDGTLLFKKPLPFNIIYDATITFDNLLVCVAPFAGAGHVITTYEIGDKNLIRCKEKIFHGKKIIQIIPTKTDSLSTTSTRPPPPPPTEKRRSTSKTRKTTKQRYDSALRPLRAQIFIMWW